MKTHLYLMSYRFEALVASQLEPEDFGLYMSVGPLHHTTGRVMFFEVDPEKVDTAYFPLDEAMQKVAAHRGPEPKRSVYVPVYRALEHVPLEALGTLYLTTRDGRTMGLEAGESPGLSEQDGPFLYVELCPVGPRVVSGLPPEEFGAYVTNPERLVHLPRVFFVDSVVETEPDGRLARRLPYRHHAHIRDCLNELEGKATKTVDRLPQLVGFYRTIRSGFYLADPTGCRHYGFPSQRELNDHHFMWWRSAQLD